MKKLFFIKQKQKQDLKDIAVRFIVLMACYNKRKNVLEDKTMELKNQQIKIQKHYDKEKKYGILYGLL